VTERHLGDELTKDLRDSFVVQEDGPDFWVISSPLLFDDGDELPIFARRDGGGKWSLTDQGMAVSHLFFDEFEYTEARFSRISQLVAAHSAELGEMHEITMPLSGRPTAFAVGTFMQLVAQVQGVALTSRSDRDQSRYVTTLRHAVEERLATAEYEENWSPQELKDKTKANYQADLRMRGVGDADVVLFAASTPAKVYVSALTMGHFGRLMKERDLRPILAYHPERVGDEAIYRFLDEVGRDDVAIPAPPEDHQPLLGALADLGVALAS